MVPMSTDLPTVVIVGRPNVGKSTFFNRVAGSRIAVVQDTPGVTRDRIYAECVHHGRRFQLVDTGGILFGDEDPLVEQIRIQAQVALADADAILMMTDATDGLHPGDWDLANLLRGSKCKVYVVPNKADNSNLEIQASEFWSLGVGEVFPVSSIHGSGIEDLFQKVVETFPKDRGEMPDDEIRLAIVGRPNVGKSSMLNALIGEQRAIVSDIPGTTRDAIDTPIVFKGRAYRLIDTAGVRRRGKIQGSVEYYMVLRATQALERAHCALLVIDGMEGLTDGDKRVAKAAHDLGKPLVIAVNKWDLREPPTGDLGKNTPIKKDFIKTIRDEMPEMSYALIRFTSALSEAGLEGVMKAVLTAYENWSFRATTGALNRVIQDALFEKPLTRSGKTARVYYATQPETRPPTVVLFCNDPDLFHFSYLRYIENQFRKANPLPGTPVRLIARRSSEQAD